MSKQNTPYHPLIYRYLKQWQDDPTSRVFAPLSEAYRKAGLVDEAIEIAREGLVIHPAFVGGRVALARALFDKKLYIEVLSELRPIIQDVPDNIVAQRLVAESCLMLGYVAEALAAFKMLLFYAPQDTDTARMVQELESSAYSDGSLVLRTDPEYNIVSAEKAISEDPDEKRGRWIHDIELLQAMLQRVERYRANILTS